MTEFRQTGTPVAALSLAALIVMALAGCASQPANVENICAIFEEKGSWYKDARKSEQRWGTPIHVQLRRCAEELDDGWWIF